MTWCGHNVRSRHAALLDRCHMYTFKLEPHDCQRSRNKVTCADKVTGCADQNWSDAPQHSVARCSRCWEAWLDTPLVLIGRETPGVRLEYRKGPESIFVDRTRPIVTDRMHHCIRSTPRVLLSLWAPDQTRWSHEWPDEPVANPSPCASIAALNWPDAPAASGYFDLSVRSLPVTSVHLRFYPQWLRENLRLWHSRKYTFHFLERGPQTHLYRSNSTFFANVLTPPSVHHHVHVC
jgi:hypothetical protein